MKTKLTILFSLPALLLVSTAILADGMPSGIRISRTAFGGDNNVEIDVTVDTTFLWNSTSSIVLIGNAWLSGGGGTFYHYASPSFSEPLPWAIDWGDGYYLRTAPLFGSSGGPYRGTFAHTYLTPGAYTITVGDALGAGATSYANYVTTGNIVYASSGIYWGGTNTGGWEDTTFSITGNPVVVALTANVTVFTGTGIPALNLYGLLALSCVLVGTGVLLYRKPQRRLA
jgi:hypothetical protein